MAASNFHARSNSFPSRPHPLILQCNEHLDRLRSSHQTSSSSSLLSHKLEGLQDLQESVENLVQLPLMQQAFLHEPNNQLLDGSLRLLDVCTTAKDSLLHTKECMRELQSCMRRRVGEVELRTEVKKFLTSRKVVRKSISKALANLKGTSKNSNTLSTINDNQNVVSLLQNMEVVTLSTFETLLQFISGTTKSKSSSWLLVSKLMQTKKSACSQLEVGSEFAELDEALQSYVFAQTSKDENMNKLQNHLEKLELVIQDLEESLEFLFRRLIKIRVALLNILNH